RGLPRVADDHPDLLRFAQDRHSRAFCGILYPAVDVATSGFIRSLERGPAWLAERDAMHWRAHEHERDQPTLEQRARRLRATHARAKCIADLKAREPYAQRIFHIKHLREVLAWCQGRPEHYVSQNSFLGWRRSSASVKQLTSCWVDLDFYPKPSSKKAENASPPVVPAIARALADDAAAVDLIVGRCLEAGKDGRWFMPTQVIRSGRGLYVKWIFDEFVPGVAKSRWKLCQARLLDIFKDMGADPKARDAARVLRVVGSVNSKAPGPPVRVLLSGKPISFNDLADALLPQQRLSQWDREAVKLLKKQASKKFGPMKLKPVPAEPVQRRAGGPSTPSSWGWTRPVIDELEQLIQVRGENNQGHMESTAFVMLVYQLLNGTLITKQEFDDRVVVLAMRMGGDAAILAGQVSSVWSQHQRELAGQKRSEKP